MLLELSEKFRFSPDSSIFFHQTGAEAYYPTSLTAKIKFDFPYRQLIRQRSLWLQENCKSNLMGCKFFCQTQKYIPENSQLLLCLLLASTNKQTLETKIKTCRKKFQSSIAFLSSLRKEGKDVKISFMLSLFGYLWQTLTKLLILKP